MCALFCAPLPSLRVVETHADVPAPPAQGSQDVEQTHGGGGQSSEARATHGHLCISKTSTLVVLCHQRTIQACLQLQKSLSHSDQ